MKNTKCHHSQVSAGGCGQWPETVRYSSGTSFLLLQLSLCSQYGGFGSLRQPLPTDDYAPPTLSFELSAWYLLSYSWFWLLASSCLHFWLILWPLDLLVMTLSSVPDHATAPSVLPLIWQFLSRWPLSPSVAMSIPPYQWLKVKSRRLFRLCTSV